MFVTQQLQNGQTQANDALDTAFDTATAQNERAGSTLGSLADSYRSGSDMYRKALGLDGAEGSTEARSAFSTSPGYDFNMDQGMQALTRARAVNGTLASGNMDTDAMKFASGLAAQDWNNWLSNLSNLDTKRYGATTAQAGTFGDIANGALTVGAAKAGLASQTAQGIAQAGAAGLQAGQQARANGLNAIISGANALGNLAGGVSKAFSIFG